MRTNAYAPARFSRLLVTLLALLLGWHAEAKADCQQSKDRLVAVEPTHERQQGAMLSDGQDLYRLCNSRPQRLTHSLSSPPTPGKWHDSGAYLPAPHETLILYHWKHGPRGIGFQFDASSRYYIFALRHIIR